MPKNKHKHLDALKRRYDAEARQKLRDARTPEEQLELIRTRRGDSARETARLYKEILDQEN